MGESRQALIVAVPKYELSDHFEDLTETVGHDVELMTAALRSSGYGVELIGATPDEPALGSRIRSAISRVCATAPEGGTVLIHFTGHGLSVDGADYLVPSDAQLTWATTPPRVDVDSLIGLDLAKLLKGCRADTVLLTVDACRDADDTGSFGGPATNFPAGRDRIAVLFGCGPGQTCGSDERLGSNFSRALAEALHADSSPRTLPEVIAHTVAGTAGFARRAREEQTPTPHYAPSGPGAIEEVELCAGRTLQEEWTLAVRDAELWAAVSCDDIRRAELQQALVELTGQCAKWCGTAFAGAPDPWADDDYPVRVLKKGLRPLLAPSQTQGGPLLDGGEFAALAAAPFVREAVYAMGIKGTAAVAPFQLDPASGDAGRDPERVDLEHTFAAHALLWRKGRELAGRGRDEDATAVAAWLLRRHVSAKEELWDAYAPQLLAPLAKAIIGDDGPSARIGELTDELVSVCRQTALAPAQPYQGERESPDARWNLDELERADGAAERWRPRELSWLIGVAGLLGGDLRQLPGVLVDNIGITDGLRPAEAVESVRRLRWARDRLTRALDLALDCPHPAIHSGLETLTGWADDAVQHIRQHLAPSEPTALLAHLPVRITCRKLRPQYDTRTKNRAYGMPLMHFSLAEDEMRELLMGNRLYGDRTLALRELYQNALDACRYRQARLHYGKAARKIPYQWTGEIVFRHGTDEETGRAYVECEDNGVGMGHETLRGTFARAGRRFEQSREYRREQAQWRRADPDLRIYPNSRFGIGVFSYFMLADEISIWTRATDEYGRAETGGGLRVDIASSGSLFRIRKGEEAQPGGGTRVRLYLQADDVDVAEELGKHVWRSEFGMRVEREGEVVRTWEAKALYYFGDHTRPVAAGEDIWWVEGKGCLLADGVLADPEAMLHAARGAGAWLAEERNSSSSSPYSRGVRDWKDRGSQPFGCVVDLRENHAPDLSTDRNSVLAYDQVWVDSRIHEACEDFDMPEWVTMEWLWAFAMMHPDGAVRVVRRLLDADVRIASQLGWNRADVEFRRVGCVPLDAGLVLMRSKSDLWDLSIDSYNGDAMEGWRTRVLRSASLPLGKSRRGLPVPETIEGYPEPQAWESRIGATRSGYQNNLSNAVLSRLPDETLTLGRVLQRLRRHAITGAQLPALDDLDVAHRMALDSVDCRALGICLLSADGASSPGGMAWGTLIGVLKSLSVEAGLSLSQAMKRVRRFAAVGLPLVVPESGTEPPADMIATNQELEVLSWHPHVSLLEREWRFMWNRPTQAQYEEVLDRYHWLGLPRERLPEAVVEFYPQEIPEPSPGEGPSLQVWTEERRGEFQQCFGIPWHAREIDLSARQLANASAVLSLSVAEVVERYAEVCAHNDIRIPNLEELADRVFSRLDSELLGVAWVEWDDGDSSWVSDPAVCPAPLLDTAVAVCKAEASTAEVVERLEVLSALGLVASEAPALAERWRAIPPSDWSLLPVDNSLSATAYGLTSREAARAVVQAGLHDAYVFAIAASTRSSVKDACTRLATLGALLGLDGLSLTLPPESSVAEARPNAWDVAACCNTVDRTLHWTPPTVEALVTHARADDRTLGESLAILSGYAPLGALWREPDSHLDDSGAWRDHCPAAHDSALFAHDLIGDDLRVGPLELLRVAARFGWRIGLAWDRLALYRPFGLELSVERPAFDTIPTWQDMVLLTEYYTGSAPALSGQVTPDRIAVAARELEQPTRWVHDRLTVYAALFGLDVPPDYPAEPAPVPTPEYFRSDAE